VKCVAAAAGIRILIKSPIKAITLRDATLFVLVAVVLVPFGAAFWGASFTVSYGFGTHYWIEWRNLGISNAVTTVVLMPAFLLGAHYLFVKRPRVLRSRSNVRIEVQDSGTGIAADKLESIFDPFITSKPEGLGLGLSICRSIIERHGGKISAANNPDGGAKFSITLPVTPD
jgi:signal transduction histidine kinase